MARRRREPTVEAREHRCADGTTTRMWSVRFYGEDGTRKRLRCGSREEAKYQRARLVYERVAMPSPAPVAVLPAAMTLGAFWPAWADDARGRLAASTFREYERLWTRRLAPKFAAVALDAVRPRDVSQWRTQLLAAGVGPEAVRYAMVLLQAMFTVAIEWGEATANPVSVVRNRAKAANAPCSRSRPMASRRCAPTPRARRPALGDAGLRARLRGPAPRRGARARAPSRA